MEYEKIIDIVSLNKDYEEITSFIKKYNLCSFIEFDYHLTNDINLFKNENNFDFELLDEKLNYIINSLGAIKRIFAHPIIRLKDNMEILPLDLVKSINAKSLSHASSHVEIFANIKDGELKPNKLLTYTNVDDYEIYENVAFKYCISLLMKFIKNNLNTVKNILYANNLIYLNPTLRIDHQLYYLALGKLQTSYAKNVDNYFDIAFNCLNKLNYIKNILVSRFVNPIYKQIKLPNKKFELKQTNIFLHHKDYKKIYHLIRYFENDNLSTSYNQKMKDNLLTNYTYFVKLMLIFAILHFNFKIEEDIIDLTNFNFNFNFKKWKINLKKSYCKNEEVILLKIKKDKEYKVLIVPFIDEEKDYSSFRKDEVVYFSLEEEEHKIHVSINSLNSFLRIQQLIHRLMILVDETYDICPFCGGKLNKVFIQNKNHYICYNCKEDIFKVNCKRTHTSFMGTKIYELEKKNVSSKDDFTFERDVENLMHYRNITNINRDLDIICPFCNRIHY